MTSYLKWLHWMQPFFGFIKKRVKLDNKTLVSAFQKIFTMATAEIVFGVMFFGSLLVLLMITVRIELFAFGSEILNGEIKQWRIWSWDRFWAKSEHSEGVRNATLALAGLAGALAGLYNLFNATRRTRALISQADCASRQEVNERYFAAMDMLIKEDPITRAGGIHQLTAIATEQPHYLDGAIRNIEFFVKQNSMKRNKGSTPSVDLMEAIKSLHILQYKIKHA